MVVTIAMTATTALTMAIHAFASIQDCTRAVFYRQWPRTQTQPWGRTTQPPPIQTAPVYGTGGTTSTSGGGGGPASITAAAGTAAGGAATTGAVVTAAAGWT